VASQAVIGVPITRDQSWTAAIRPTVDVEDENKKLTSHDAKASRLLTATLHVLILLLGLNSQQEAGMGA